MEHGGLLQGEDGLLVVLLDVDDIGYNCENNLKHNHKNGRKCTIGCGKRENPVERQAPPPNPPSSPDRCSREAFTRPVVVPLPPHPSTPLSFLLSFPLLLLSPLTLGF